MHLKNTNLAKFNKYPRRLLKQFSRKNICCTWKCRTPEGRGPSLREYAPVSGYARHDATETAAAIAQSRQTIFATFAAITVIKLLLVREHVKKVAFLVGHSAIDQIL